MRNYTTSQGDQWDMIAYKMYPNVGKEYLMSTLLAANQEHLQTVIFPANVVLQIPDVALPGVENMPPWKR
jgi:Phage Tail Protein X.